MNPFENLPINNGPKKEVLDEKWYSSFEKIGAFQDFEYLTGKKEHREDQKQKFISGEIENPELDYPELETFDFSSKEQSLLELKRAVITTEPNETLNQLYRWKINEKIADLRMLQATKNGNDKKFSRYSKFIYGEPDREIFEYTISQIKSVVDKQLFSEDADIKNAAERLNKNLFDALANNANTIFPENFDIPATQNKKEEKEYSTEEIRAAFENFLKEKAVDGWKVVVDTSGRFTSLNISQDKKEINIPSTRRLKETALQELIAHELGTHVMRREKGEHSKLKLLGLGLDRYLKGEGGISTYAEQKISGFSDFSGLDGHLAIALATGSDGKKRNFREVFEILRDIYFIKSKKNKEEAWESAENSAWTRCVRTFRGTICKTPGACLTRDIVYREGNIAVWNLVKENSPEVRRFSVGKYDPSNPRHIWILDQLGITDEDLDSLDKASKK